MLVKVDGKTYINNITIINNNKKKKTFTTEFMHYKKLLDKIFADQHNSNIKKFAMKIVLKGGNLYVVTRAVKFKD